MDEGRKRVLLIAANIPAAPEACTVYDGVVFLDHDVHWMHAADNAIVKGTGKEVAMHLSKTGFKGIVVIHSKNEDGARVMLKILPGAKVARFGEFEINLITPTK
ncbi:MAG: hypothetical protein ACYDDS_08215 [Candidatus Sulfotelmatobacter sp.]